MLLNNTISNNYTDILGHDNKLSFEGSNLLKDTTILNNFMDINKIPNKILHSVLIERELIRKYY